MIQAPLVGFGVLDGQDRAGREAHDAFGDATEHRVLEPGQPARSHHDQIGVNFLGCQVDCHRGAVGCKNRLGLDTLVGHEFVPIAESLCSGVANVLVIARGEHDPVRGDARGLNVISVEQVNRRSKQHRDLNRGIERFLGVIREIDGYQNRFESSHGRSPSLRLHLHI